MVTAQSTQLDAHLPRPPKKHPMKKPKRKKFRNRYTSHCGGKQVKYNGEQNYETSCPNNSNPVIEVHANEWRTSFKYRDGSMDSPSLCLPPGKSASVFSVPVGQVAQVILHYESGNNYLWGISMVDRKGNTLFKTYDHPWADASHTISLEEGESIVGFRSHAWDNGK
jgi:hypothetical protein